MMTNTQHFINAFQRAQTEDIQIFANGAPGSQGFIAINNDKGYNVEVVNNEIVRCNCPHNTYRGVICKHMVKASLAKGINIAQLNTIAQEDTQVG
jgi:predicted amino acid dehydrogenase